MATFIHQHCVFNGTSQDYSTDTRKMHLMENETRVKVDMNGKRLFDAMKGKEADAAPELKTNHSITSKDIDLRYFIVSFTFCKSDH